MTRDFLCPAADVQGRLEIGRRLRPLWAVVLGLVLFFGVEQPALAEEGSSVGCDGVELAAPDEWSARDLAAECGVPVEIDSARSFTDRQFAQPDGTVTLESHLRPQWALDASGNWVEANPTLVVDPVRGISTVATPVEVTVSPGGQAPLVTATDTSGGSVSLTWPEQLPEPVLEGATATYPDVYEGVDLQVTAGVDWFSYALVVHSAEAAANGALASIDVQVGVGGGLELSQGSDEVVAARDAAGEVVFSAVGAYMWDSSSPPRANRALSGGPVGGDIPGGDPGRVAQMEVELDGGDLRVIPDQEMLTDPAVEFPVTMDPTFTGTRLAWTTVGNGQYAGDTWWDDAAWPRVDGLRVGFMGWSEPGSEGYGRWRSLARFDTSSLVGATINSAQVGLTVYHTGGCESYPLELWHTRIVRQGEVPTSWNSTKSDWLQGGPMDVKTVASANSTGDWCDQVNPDRQVVFDGDGIVTVVQRRADKGYRSMGFGLRSGDESDLLQWMRAYAESFTVTVNYTPVVAVPTGLVVDGTGCLAPAGSRVAGTAPVLAGVPRNSEGTVEAQFEVRTGDGQEAVRSWSAPEGSSDEQVSWQVDPPLADGAYLWRMRSDRPGGDTASDWSGWCEFTVDSALEAEPEPEAAEPLECPVADGDPLEAADESIALLLAQACEAPAEVTSERDFDVRVMAQPEGTLVAEQFTQPQWAHDADGEWVEADPSFETAADGGISTTAAVSEIEVSDGGDGPLLTATDPEGGSVSLTWPASLPEPVIEGEVVTYPEVLPDVDLQVSAGVDGFSYVLVVKSPSAATSPELDRVSVGIEADGLELVQADDGTVEIRDAAGEAVFSAPAAYMWDSSEPVDDGGEPSALQDDEEGSGEDDGTPGRFTDMPLDLDGAAGSLAVVPDEELLEDPEAEFPIVIDPPFVGKRMHWATVHKAQPGRSWTDDSKWPRDVGLRIGNLQNWDRPPWCGRSCGLWRSAVRFNIKKLSGRQVISAAVKATQVHTSGCDSYGLQLWYLTAFKSGASWNSLSDNWQNRLQSKSVASSNRTGGCGGSTPARGVTFGNSAVKDRVQSHANAGHKSLSFGFRSSNESSKAAYRRLALKSVRAGGRVQSAGAQTDESEH